MNFDVNAVGPSNAGRDRLTALTNSCSLTATGHPTILAATPAYASAEAKS